MYVTKDRNVNNDSYLTLVSWLCKGVFTPDNLILDKEIPIL